MENKEEKKIEETFTKEDLIDVMNLGMDLRQNQLQGYISKSGINILEEWIEKRNENKFKQALGHSV